MSVIIGSARHDENGKYTNGSINIQDASEVSQQNFYVHSKGWVILRARNEEKRNLIADCMVKACESKYGGYDQNNRDDLYNKSIKYGFDVSKVTQNWETDCSALVRVCVNYAGISVGDFYTGNARIVLLATGDFEEIKYKSESQLLTGDILCTISKGHIIVVTKGNEQTYTPNTWIQDGKKWKYSISEREIAKKCWKDINGHRYYFDENGVMASDWKQIGNEWYYFQPSGSLEGALYRSDANGVQSIWNL